MPVHPKVMALYRKYYVHGLEGESIAGVRFLEEVSEQIYVLENCNKLLIENLDETR